MLIKDVYKTITGITHQPAENKGNLRLFHDQIQLPCSDLYLSNLDSKIIVTQNIRHWMIDFIKFGRNITYC